MTKQHILVAYKLVLAAILIGCLLAIAGCQSVSDTLGSVDYACVDIELAPAYTDSGVLGRGIILPEGETLTADTVSQLCDY